MNCNPAHFALPLRYYALIPSSLRFAVSPPFVPACISAKRDRVASARASLAASPASSGRARAAAPALSRSSSVHSASNNGQVQEPHGVSGSSSSMLAIGEVD